MRYLKFAVVFFLATEPIFPLRAATVDNSAFGHSLARSVNLRIKTEFREIQTGMKSRKINQLEADNLRTQLKNIRRQELLFFKQNGTHEITSSQQNQLNTLLDKNEQAIGHGTANAH
ncbi:MAG: hypothetical protein ACREL1_08400 [bacterium]